MTNPMHLAALAAEGQRSAQTTDLGERLLWVGVLILVVVGVYLLMWRAWKRRAAQQADLPELPPVPEPVQNPIAELTGRYHGSTSSGDWLDRIVARGLGTHSLAQLTLTEGGVAVRRQGAASFLIPAAALRGARLDQGIAGKVLTEGGLLVITWQHGGRLLDSGFRSDHPAEHAAWVAAVHRLTQAGDPPDDQAATPDQASTHNQASTPDQAAPPDQASTHNQEGAR